METTHKEAAVVRHSVDTAAARWFTVAVTAGEALVDSPVVEVVGECGIREVDHLGAVRVGREVLLRVCRGEGRGGIVVSGWGTVVWC